MGAVVVVICGLATVVALVLFPLHGTGEEYSHVKAKEKSKLAGS